MQEYPQGTGAQDCFCEAGAVGSRWGGAGGVRTGQSDGCSGQLAALPTSTRTSQPGLPVCKASVFFLPNSLHMSVAMQRSSLKILKRFL